MPFAAARLIEANSFWNRYEVMLIDEGLVAMFFKDAGRWSVSDARGRVLVLSGHKAKRAVSAVRSVIDQLHS